MITNDAPAPVTLETLKSAVGRTWFDLEEKASSFEFETRDNGDVGGGEAGKADFDEARRIITAIHTAYSKDLYDVRIDDYDEWVFVVVRKAPYSAEEITDNELKDKKRRVYSTLRDSVGALPKPISPSVRPAIKMEGFPETPITLIADFGERFANLNHLGAQVVFKTEGEAEKALRDFTDSLPAMPILGWEVEYVPVFNRTSHSGSPIENIGKVKFSVKM